MSKSVVILSIFILLFIFHVELYATVQDLIDKSANDLIAFFNDKPGSKVSINGYDVFIDISDNVSLRLYQILVGKLESSLKMDFIDQLIDLNNGRGRFNNTNTHLCHFLINLKIIRHRDKIGIGAVVFSRLIDKIVYVSYQESAISQGEENILGIVTFSFMGSGFFKTVELNMTRNLLDIRTFIHQGMEIQVFYFSHKFDFYNASNNNQFKKISSFNIEWPRPYYPVLEAEGRLLLFNDQNIIHLIIGGNFAPYAQDFIYDKEKLVLQRTYPFLPLKMIFFNNQKYYIGAKYDEGKNTFLGKILLAPVETNREIPIQVLEKDAPAFYSLDIANNENKLESIHLIDIDYSYHFLGSDFNELYVEQKKHGGAIAIGQNQWLAMSDYRMITDKIFFYRIDGGKLQLIYEADIEGEVVFISEGTLFNKPGFWIYIRLIQGQTEVYKAQFWSHNQ